MILLIGGTRGTGLLIARLLERQGAAIRVMARNADAAKLSVGGSIDVVGGDITKASTLPRAFAGVTHVIFTAGVRSGHPASNALSRATDYEGVVNTLDAARASGFGGRFLYLTSGGVTRRSAFSVLLNLYKGNTLVWRERAERAIRDSQLDYTIIRAGVLLNQPGGRRAIRVSQDPLPLSLRYCIARADVAAAIVAALDHPQASRVTCDVAWDHAAHAEPWPDLFARLHPD